MSDICKAAKSGTAETPFAPSAMAQGAQLTNWRAIKKLTTDKLDFMMTQGIFTDVTFSVGPNEELISAHRLILMMNSAVFEAMFNGPLKMEDDVIHIPDVEPHVFRAMLKYMYTGTFECSLQNAVNLMYTAKKYDLEDLSIKCSQLLQTDLNERNVVTLFQAAALLNDKELETKAKTFITRHFCKILEEEDFLTFTYENLCHFLVLDDLDVVEIDLFNALLKWSSAQCERNGMELNSANQSECLKGSLRFVRFPVMSSEDFALQVVPSGVLKPEQCLLILQYMSVPFDKRKNLPSMEYMTQGRNTNCVYSAHFAVRLTDMVYPYVSHISYFDSFEVDQYISVISFGFPAPDLDDAVYDVAVQIQLQGSVVITAQTNQSLLVKRRSIFRVRFEKPVRIEPNVLYKVVYKLKGPDTFYADQRVENLQVQAKNTKNKTVNFKFIAYSCRLVEIAFVF